jgi:signal transduction histidine kinase
MDDEGDRDLRSITHSFNEMVDSLQERIEREARFASEVSHELRTPLTALSTSIEVVSRRKDELPERVRRAVDVLESQVAYFERLVLDLLEISRLDAGVESALHEDVDLREFVERLAELHHAPRPACEGDGSWVVRVDKRRLERVLANLVENANRHGGGVSAIRLRSADGCVAIAVEDQGPGIPPEDRSRVFERFWRGVAARQSATKGTGLGMALVARHLNMLGGTISVEANEREGARLVVSLPAPQEPA